MYKVWVSTLLLVMIVGCGSNKSSNKIDMSEYLPKITTKDYTEVIKPIDIKMTSSEFSENIILGTNKITIEVDGSVKATYTILDDKINIELVGDENQTKTMKRKVSKGNNAIEYVQESQTETLKVGSQVVGEQSIRVEESCELVDDTIDEFTKYFYVYENSDDEHNIIKLKCTTVKTEITSIEPEFIDDVVYENGTIEFKPNTSYIYLQRGIGVIAEIDDDCVVEKSPKVVIDDTAKPSECIGEQYHYTLYHND